MFPTGLTGANKGRGQKRRECKVFSVPGLHLLISDHDVHLWVGNLRSPSHGSSNLVYDLGHIAAAVTDDISDISSKPSFLYLSALQSMQIESI
jgi:hypothetical protein